MIDIVHQISAVLLVFGLLALALWTLRRAQAGKMQIAHWRSGPPKNAAAVESLARFVLTAQHSVHVLRIQGRDVVLVTHPQGCTLIHPDSPPVEGGV